MDKKLVKVSPIMTSANTPAPYEVTASSYYSNNHAPWYAFDGNETYVNNVGYWSSGGFDGSIIINYSKPTPIDCFSVYGGYSTVAIYGSDDNKTYTLLKTYNVGSSDSSKAVMYYLDKQTKYTYYKFYFSGTRDWIAIMEIEMFMQKTCSEKIKDTVKNAILNNKLIQHLTRHESEE